MVVLKVGFEAPPSLDQGAAEARGGQGCTKGTQVLGADPPALQGSGVNPVPMRITQVAFKTPMPRASPDFIGPGGPLQDLNSISNFPSDSHGQPGSGSGGRSDPSHGRGTPPRIT